MGDSHPRLVDHRFDKNTGAVEEILAPQADQRIERQSVPRRLVRQIARYLGVGLMFSAHCFAVPFAGIRSASVSAINAGF